MALKNPFSHLDCNFVLNKSQRAKRLSIRIKAPKTVSITIPSGVSDATALAFAIENLKWIESKLELTKERTSNNIRTITSKDNFQTKFHQFIFIPHTRTDAFIRIQKNETRLYFPNTWNESGEQVQNLVKKALTETYRREAKSYLPTRLKLLAEKHSFTYRQVSIRDNKRRWGSCSSQKNINLSLALMSLPYHLIDYVLLHELCHTIEMNHGPRFHALLDKVCNNKRRELEREIKRFIIQ